MLRRRAGTMANGRCAKGLIQWRRFLRTVELQPGGRMHNREIYTILEPEISFY
jgi:hypothetical protein